MHPDGPANGGLDTPEQLVGDVKPEHRDVSPLLHVDVGERSPRGERVVLHDHVGGGDAEDEDVPGGAVAPLHIRHRRRPSRLQRDRFRIGDRALDEADVFGGDDGPPLDLLPRLVVDEPDLNGIAADLKGVDAHDRAREPFADVRIHPLNHRDDGDEKRDRDDDAEQRKERTELVAPDGLQGEADGFVERHGWKLQCEMRNSKCEMYREDPFRLSHF